MEAFGWVKIQSSREPYREISATDPDIDKTDEEVKELGDTPAKLQRNYGNLVRVSEWIGDTEDTELLDLAKYLRWLAPQGKYRSIEKRGWRRVNFE